MSFLLAALAGGCDFFRPAEPEPPPSGDFVRPDYSDPDSVLATMARAITDKAGTNGQSVYVGAFADSIQPSTPSYRHLFAQIDMDEWNGLGRTVPLWDLQKETFFYSEFIRLRSDVYVLEWEPDVRNPDVRQDTRVDLFRHYRLSTRSLTGSETSVLAQGYADLILIQFPDGTWRIVSWADRRDPDAPTGVPSMGRQRLNLGG